MSLPGKLEGNLPAIWASYWVSRCLRTTLTFAADICAPTHADWLLGAQLQKMVMVVTSTVSKATLERWTFDILTDRTALAAQCAPPPARCCLNICCVRVAINVVIRTGEYGHI